MAEETLVGPNVRLAQKLTRILDQAGMPPRAVLWVNSPEGGSWRLWVVPPPGLDDKRAFYLQVAEIVAEHQSELSGFDIGELQFVRADHPAIRGLRAFVRVDGVSDVRMTNNLLNGYLLPDSVIIRMTA